jgi:L-fuculose-phosphate aldolase
LTERKKTEYILQIMASPFTIRKNLTEVGNRLYQRGMLAGTDGNLSVRLDDDRIMVTPSSLPKGLMKPDDLVIVDARGKVLQGSRKPSS